MHADALHARVCACVHAFMCSGDVCFVISVSQLLCYKPFGNFTCRLSRIPFGSILKLPCSISQSAVPRAHLVDGSFLSNSAVTPLKFGLGGSISRGFEWVHLFVFNENVCFLSRARV